MHPDTLDQATSHADASLHARPRLWLLWGMSVASAGIGTWLLYDELPGINWTLWTLTASLGFVFWARTDTRPLGAERATLLALACCLAAGAAMTGMSLLQVAIALCILMLAALVILASDTPLADESPANLTLAPLAAAAEIVTECTLRASEAATSLRAEQSLPALRGSILAAPIVIAFFLLLSAADPTLANWRTSAWSTLSSLSFVPPVLLFIILGTATLGAFGIAARRSAELDDTITHVDEPQVGVLGATERLIVLGSVAVLFAVFLILQLSYLFDNSGSRAGSGLTFADAAHRGFIELTLTATLTAVLVIALDRFALRSARENVVKYCALVLLAESLPMLLSANSRISHYEAAYGYSLLRLYVHVYIAIVGVAMLLLARQTLSSIDLGRLVQHLAITATIAIAVLSFWNHAAWIVEKNVDRYVAERKLDVMHLTRVAAAGPDAIPQLVTSLPRLAPADAAFLRRYLSEHDPSSALDEHQPRWYRWNLRRTRANDALQRLAEQEL